MYNESLEFKKWTFGPFHYRSRDPVVLDFHSFTVNGKDEEIPYDIEFEESPKDFATVKRPSGS